MKAQYGPEGTIHIRADEKMAGVGMRLELTALPLLTHRVKLVTEARRQLRGKPRPCCPRAKCKPHGVLLRLRARASRAEASKRPLLTQLAARCEHRRRDYGTWRHPLQLGSAETPSHLIEQRCPANAMTDLRRGRLRGVLVVLRVLQLREVIA
jgi:hypothetical protein